MATHTHEARAGTRYPPRSPNRQGAPGRFCAEPGCNVKLSIYNRGDLCWLHAPDIVEHDELLRANFSPYWTAHGTWDMWRAGCKCPLCMDPEVVSNYQRGAFTRYHGWPATGVLKDG